MCVKVRGCVGGPGVGRGIGWMGGEKGACLVFHNVMIQPVVWRPNTIKGPTTICWVFRGESASHILVHTDEITPKLGGSRFVVGVVTSSSYSCSYPLVYLLLRLVVTRDGLQQNIRGGYRMQNIEKSTQLLPDEK